MLVEICLYEIGLPNIKVDGECCGANLILISEQKCQSLSPGHQAGANWTRGGEKEIGFGKTRIASGKNVVNRQIIDLFSIVAFCFKYYIIQEARVKFNNPYSRKKTGIRSNADLELFASMQAKGIERCPRKQPPIIPTF